MVSNQKDYELVKQFIEGDLNSIEVLINRHKKRVYTYILLIVKDQQLAEDIFQDTFIKVIKSLKRGKYQEKGIFVSWVVRIAHNLIIDYYRKSKHFRTISSEDSDADVFNSKKLADGNIEDFLIQEQITKDVRKIVEFLPFEQKEVILLRHFGELSFKEIAEKTGVSINTSLGRMRYALINLRKLIQEKELILTKS
ncbi:MAG: sigma-70 family RNA polymerase sigma factor [Bacteroidales bacterium]|nr:sigma-70 family RNA polymerase sigma factor [Bacteroidales bacterium]MBN2757878.1 sigma-70 family RNA polymerase sigma factor [Bacteroidales bacterium]